MEHNLIQNYINNINRLFQTGNAREHSYRGDLQELLNQIINDDNIFAPIDILDYIYAVLHSLSYREKYKEFLKIDFSRVPYPDIKNFW